MPVGREIFKNVGVDVEKGGPYVIIENVNYIVIIENIKEFFQRIKNRTTI